MKSHLPNSSNFKPIIQQKKKKITNNKLQNEKMQNKSTISALFKYIKIKNKN